MSVLPSTRSAEPQAAPDEPHAGPVAAPAVMQQVVKIRRDYNAWVATETLEDYALRYTPQRFRKWSHWRVAHTAFGAASFLILEAVGATLLVQYGWANAFWAIVATGLIIFAAGLPISVYAARYGLDMDLLTRGAGFGYIGSTITSLIYASFTFIFFALEAAVMAYALKLALNIPPVWGYALCALVVIPLVTHGVSIISRLQLWTQPLWLVMLIVPFAYVAWHEPGVFTRVLHYGGEHGAGSGFSLSLFGAALTVGIALITQMGEQADYLRFMPQRTRANRWRWWGSVLLGGPGWVLLGVAKMLGGALLAYLAISHAVPAEHAVDPNQMYVKAYSYVFSHYGWAVAATALFVVLSQLKINVTNAYAGSLAWSNFFSRLTHSHPGRVVWVVFNTFIAFMLMEMNVFSALGQVLGLYSNLAIAWIMAVVADLVINKPLGLSPQGIEFKRAHLYDINPVGVGAMALASMLSIAAHLGAFGAMAQAFSAVIAMVVALVTSPLIAWATKGRYYLARTSTLSAHCSDCRQGTWCGQAATTVRCTVCERNYEVADMAHCPAYGGHICSLCCTLDARCGDLCKPQANLSVQWRHVLRWLLPSALWRLLDKGLGHFVLLMLVIAPLLAAVLGLLYHQELQTLLRDAPVAALSTAQHSLRSAFIKAYGAMLLVAGIVAWWLVLAQQSRRVAQEESNRQTGLLVREIALHEQTDAQLQSARKVAEQARAVAEAAREAADQANQAKTRYLSAISHELRTPLNSILGYAQLMGQDRSIAPQHQQAVRVIKRGGEHLLSLIEGTLDMARIESGKLALDVAPMRFADGMRELADMFALQAKAKGLHFHYEPQGQLPAVVRADEKRLRQILINLLGNAIKFTEQGGVTLRVLHARQMATVEVQDTGPGLSEAEQAQIFEPFVRGDAAAGVGGAGLGLTMAKMLTELMGGALTVRSNPGQGACFVVRLFLPSLESAQLPSAQRNLWQMPSGYVGPRRTVLVVDNETADRQVLQQLLGQLGFGVEQAASGMQALQRLGQGLRPDAILLDLAMPGIDGWETLRRIRAMPWGQMPCAIVSANAFDRGQDNDVAIGPQDFIVKPVRHAELLAWLQQALGLQWDYADDGGQQCGSMQTVNALEQGNVATGSTAQTVAAKEALPVDIQQARLDLQRALQLGYPRGIQQALAALEAAAPQQAEVWSLLRSLAQNYDFDAMQRVLAQATQNARAPEAKEDRHD